MILELMFVKILRNQGRNRHIFWRGKVISPDFFPGVKCVFPVENSHFGRPNQISVVSNVKCKEKKKKKKGKRSSPRFITFPTSISNFPPPFYNFSFFPFSLPLFFPIRQQKIPLPEVSGGTLPPACYATVRNLTLLNTYC